MRPLLRARLAVVAAIAVALVAPQRGSAVAAPAKRAACTDAADRAVPYRLRVDGETATGRIAYPRKAPAALAVFAHGLGHTSASWVNHMRAAAKHGMVAVTMEYRGLKISPDANGDGYPESRGFNVWKGSEDLIAAARTLERTCRSVRRVILFSISMGSNMAGIALARSAEISRPETNPLFDDWIDVEGEVNLIESYNEARLVAPSGNKTAVNVVTDIETECGGTFEEVPDAYLDRTVVARIDDIAASGVRSAVVIHAIDDGLVPYNQGREMATLLFAAGIPTDMITVGTKSPQSERETTLTGYAGSEADPDYTSPLAGHGSEKSDTHIVIVTAFQRLWALVAGEQPGPYREFFVDGHAGTFPSQTA
ncbi:MAG: alpha/beta fold hydrolase [Actinobacteria bacterium]|nr:alpha/beta fold hydrolase [Actinomycetota bacterium]